MSTVKSIMISHIESQYTHEYIANVFWYQGLARIKKITMIPYLSSSGETYSTAYILIDSWGETEAAYGFIKRLMDSKKEARIIHYDEEWWAVQVNTHNDGDLDCSIYTVTFDRDYYDAPTEMNTEDEAEEDEEFDFTEVQNVTLRAHQKHFQVV